MAVFLEFFPSGSLTNPLINKDPFSIRQALNADEPARGGARAFEKSQSLADAWPRTPHRQDLAPY